MKIHESHAKKIFTDYAIPTCRWEVVSRPEEAADAFGRLAHPSCMAKVQVLMGGRGKAGGVLRVKTGEEARQFAEKFLGKLFSTTQSAGESKLVKTVILTEDIPIRSEYYLGIVVDRTKDRPVILFYF